MNFNREQVWKGEGSCCWCLRSGINTCATCMCGQSHTLHFMCVKRSRHQCWPHHLCGHTFYVAVAVTTATHLRVSLCTGFNPCTGLYDLLQGLATLSHIFAVACCMHCWCCLILGLCCRPGRHTPSRFRLHGMPVVVWRIWDRDVFCQNTERLWVEQLMGGAAARH